MKQKRAVEAGGGGKDTNLRDSPQLSCFSFKTELENDFLLGYYRKENCT